MFLLCSIFDETVSYEKSVRLFNIYRQVSKVRGVEGPINEKVRNLARGFVSNLHKNSDFSANFFQLLITFLSLLCIPASKRLV